MALFWLGTQGDDETQLQWSAPLNKFLASDDVLARSILRLLAQL